MRLPTTALARSDGRTVSAVGRRPTFSAIDRHGSTSPAISGRACLECVGPRPREPVGSEAGLRERCSLQTRQKCTAGGTIASRQPGRLNPSEQAANMPDAGDLVESLCQLIAEVAPRRPRRVIDLLKPTPVDSDQLVGRSSLCQCHRSFLFKPTRDHACAWAVECQQVNRLPNWGL
jgi:hypothetical protein